MTNSPYKFKSLRVKEGISYSREFTFCKVTTDDLNEYNSILNRRISEGFETLNSQVNLCEVNGHEKSVYTAILRKPRNNDSEYFNQSESEKRGAMYDV